MTSRTRNRVRQAKAGAVSAVAVLALGFIFPALQSAEAQTFTILHTFTGGVDGGHSSGPLTEGPDNELYGAAATGGKYLYGNVFKMTKNGKKETVLNSFRYWNGDSANSYLALDPSGAIFGATNQGGDDNYDGVFYELRSRNKEQVLHQFPYSVTTDGYNPTGPIVADAQGNFYGTTRNGGTTGNGTIFNVDSSGNETVLYNFLGQADGAIPLGLALGTDGALYGATSCSTGSCYSGGGTVFRIDTSGNLTTLYSFGGGADGNVPNGALLFDAAGNIYGTTNQGGLSGCSPYLQTCGTIFKLAPDGTETVLYDFQGSTDGGGASSGVIADAKGNLYGVTSFGGDLSLNFGGGCGVVYELNAKGKEIVLHTFEQTDGCMPTGELLLSNHALYGVAPQGGTNLYGAVFKIDLK